MHENCETTLPQKFPNSYMEIPPYSGKFSKGLTFGNSEYYRNFKNLNLKSSENH